MKKRFSTFILTIATMLTCIFGLCACGGKVEFKINFVVENEVYATVSTSGNEVISMPENPTKDDYTFDGWYWDENTWEKPFTANSLLDAPLSSDMKVYAKFNKNHTHEYTPTTTEPTCAEKGLITYTCSCGDSYTEEIPATGEHTWDDGKITTEPTCTEKGVKTFTCTVCKTATYTEDVEALKHDEKTHEAKAPTCTEIGWEEYVTCERKGCDYSTYKEISATGVHTWDKGEETKAPTCTKEGVTTYTCTVCKTTTKTEPIDKLPHEHAEKWTSNATYHWHECSCGDKDGEEKHTAGAPATATTPQTCTVCGYVLQEETGILFNTLTVGGTNVYGKVSNDTEIFSFINEITMKGDATYVVDVNISCKDPIESKTVELSVGDNKFYVLEKIGNNVKLFTVTIRRRPMYEVTFDVDGGTSVQKQVIEEDYFATEPETTRTGYTFTGWDYDFTQAITKKTKITASWSANTDTKYTVNYYLQNLEDDNYTLHETVELKGETDTTATADIKEYAHFTYNASESVISGNINGDGSQVLSVYYTRDKYVISTARNNTKAGTVTAGGTCKFDKQITLTATTNAGYTWLGWYDGETCVCESEEFTFKAEKDVTYTATWSANTDTKYTINYYLQNLEDDNYTLRETVELKGTTDTTAYGETDRYAHFTYNASKSLISGNINGDGGQVLSVYYTRDKYVISTARNNTKAGTVTAGGTYKFDKQITLTATTNAGYTWLGWYDGETCVCESEEFKFKAEKDVTYTATWSANTDTKYTINYYLQNLEDDNYTLRENVELEGETDTTATAEIKEYAHFTYNVSKSVISGNIDGDGSRVLSVYYTRNKYTLSVNNTSYGAITNGGTHKYGKEITSTASVKLLGYEFVGWYSGEDLISTDTTYTFTVDKNVMARFAVKAEMSSFTFTSTTTTCSITGIKDKTITEIVVPDYVTSISQGAFSGCTSLESITIPFVGGSRKTPSNTYQYPFGYIFGTSSYTGGTATTQYYYGSSTSSTTSSTYYIPTSLKKVTVTGGNILYGAFYNCSSLTSVVIGDSVTSIGDYAFEYCSALTSVHISSIESWCNIEFGNFYSNPLSYAENLYLNGELVTELVIPNTVTEIKDHAFHNCESLTSVVIPDSVTSIGWSAFNSCDSLKSVVIPDSVTSIRPYAFEDCTALTSVEIGDSVTSIGNYAFAYCDSLTSIEIPDSVTSIGEGAFSSCDSLTSVVIGDSVTSIGYRAFYNCSSLNIVYYKGTASDWSKISIHSSNNTTLTNATRYYYSETQPTTTGNYWYYVDGVPTKW